MHEDIQKFIDTLKKLETETDEETRFFLNESLYELEQAANTELISEIKPYNLRSFLERVYASMNNEITIGTVQKCDPDYQFEPVTPIYRVGKLNEIADKIWNRELYVIFDHHEFDPDGGPCDQLYIVTPDLYDEYQQLYDAAWERVQDLGALYISPDLLIIADFLLKYKNDDRLIEIWAAAY